MKEDILCGWTRREGEKEKAEWFWERMNERMNLPSGSHSKLLFPTIGRSWSQRHTCCYGTTLHFAVNFHLPPLRQLIHESGPEQFSHPILAEQTLTPSSIISPTQLTLFNSPRPRMEISRDGYFMGVAQSLQPVKVLQPPAWRGPICSTYSSFLFAWPCMSPDSLAPLPLCRLRASDAKSGAMTRARPAITDAVARLLSDAVGTTVRMQVTQPWDLAWQP